MTSLRRKKAFYSFCQLVSDWLEVKVVAGRTRVMLAERLERRDRVGDGMTGGGGGEGSGIWAQESFPTPPVLMTLQEEIQNTHTQLRIRPVLSQQRAARGQKDTERDGETERKGVSKCQWRRKQKRRHQRRGEGQMANDIQPISFTNQLSW